jgi:hypothetical protein
MPNVRNLLDATLQIRDGTTPTPNTLTIPVEEGTLKWTVAVQERHAVLHRGRLHSWKSGKQVPVTVEFDIIYTEYEGKTLSNADPSPIDALLQQGNASAWVTTNAVNGEYTTDIRYTITAPSGDAADQDETVTFSDFIVDTVEPAEADDVTRIAIKGRALITQPDIVRS